MDCKQQPPANPQIVACTRLFYIHNLFTIATFNDIQPENIRSLIPTSNEKFTTFKPHFSEQNHCKL